MKVSELSGALLDFWVAKVENWPNLNWSDGRAMTQAEWIESHDMRNGPSTSWTSGGPIVNRLVDYGYVIMRTEPGGPVRIMNAFGATDGRTTLEAAMRAHVRSRFGHEVPDEGQ